MSMPPPPPAYPFNEGAPPPPPYGAPTGQYAGFGSRLVGYLLDSILYGLPSGIVVGAGIALLTASFRDCSGTDASGATTCLDGEIHQGLAVAGGALIVAGILVSILMIVLYLRALGRTGQTWGRKMVNIKVVDKLTGQPIGVGRALGRQLFEGFISGYVCFLGFLWMLWDKDKQTWHDKVVGSVVVKV